MCMLYLFLKDLLLDASVSCHRFDFKNSFIAIKLFLVMMLNLFLDLKVKRGVKVWFCVRASTVISINPAWFKCFKMIISWKYVLEM